MNRRITQLDEITDIANNDILSGVDVSDTSFSPSGTNKRFTKVSLLTGLAPLDVVS